MGLYDVENFLTGRIEGFFKKHLTDEVTLGELQKTIEREIARQKKNDDGIILAPRVYNFLINTDDYNRLPIARLTESLTVTAQKETIRHNAFIEGELKVKINCAVEMSTGFEFFAGDNDDDIDNTVDHTIVLKRDGFVKPMNLPLVHSIASLSVVDGDDKDAYLEFGERKIYIGRREQNDFILTDNSVSRLQASIEYRDYRHFLRDENSANGTIVNDVKRDFVCLSDGDYICMGNTMLVYEVVD